MIVFDDNDRTIVSGPATLRRLEQVTYNGGSSSFTPFYVMSVDTEDAGWVHLAVSESEIINLANEAIGRSMLYIEMTLCYHGSNKPPVRRLTFFNADELSSFSHLPGVST